MVLYEMIEHLPPYFSIDQKEIPNSVLRGEKPALSKKGRDENPILEKIFKECLSDLGKRPTADAILKELNSN